MEKAAKFFASGTFLSATPCVNFSKISLNAMDLLLFVQVIVATDPGAKDLSSAVSLTGSNHHAQFAPFLATGSQYAVPHAVKNAGHVRENYVVYETLCSLAQAGGSVNHCVEFDSVLGSRSYDVDPQTFIYFVSLLSDQKFDISVIIDMEKFAFTFKGYRDNHAFIVHLFGFLRAHLKFNNNLSQTFDVSFRFTGPELEGRTVLEKMLSEESVLAEIRSASIGAAPPKVASTKPKRTEKKNE